MSIRAPFFVWVGLILCIHLSGCSKSVDQNTIVGKWRSASGMAEEFLADGTKTDTFMGVVSSGRWSVVKLEGSKLTITEQPGGVSARGTPFHAVSVEVTFDGADKMRSVVASNPNAPTIEYERVK